MAHNVTDNKTVRFYLDGNTEGDHWVAARIEDGQLRLMAPDALIVLPHSSNVVLVENRQGL